jgi:putative DNA methylase
MTKRLIEQWLPIVELDLESARQRTPMTPVPAQNRLTVWSAHRALVASRAPVLASLLPANSNGKALLHRLGSHGNPVAVTQRIATAKKTGEDQALNGYGYGYPRARQSTPSKQEEIWRLEESQKFGIEQPTLLDLTVGEDRFRSNAYGWAAKPWANDSNSVAAPKSLHGLKRFTDSKAFADCDRLKKIIKPLISQNA